MIKENKISLYKVEKNGNNSSGGQMYEDYYVTHLHQSHNQSSLLISQVLHLILLLEELFLENRLIHNHSCSLTVPRGQVKSYKPETVQKRLGVYHQQTQPLIEYYTAKNILKSVDGTKDMEDVFQSIVSILV